VSPGGVVSWVKGGGKKGINGVPMETGKFDNTRKVHLFFIAAQPKDEGDHRKKNQRTKGKRKDQWQSGFVREGQENSIDLRGVQGGEGAKKDKEEKQRGKGGEVGDVSGGEIVLGRLTVKRCVQFVVTREDPQ